MTSAKIAARALHGFDDSSFGPIEWNTLLARGQSDIAFLTWEWQTAWWECFGRGQLLLIAAERDGEVVALAPLFTEAGMVYFVGSGGSDYLDFIGDISEPEILDTLLVTARERVRGFIGFVFYHVPDNSATGKFLQQAGERLGLKVFDEGELAAPVLELAARPESGLAAPNKKSLVRHEHYFSCGGELRALHLRCGEQILPHLDEFFAQHCQRWAATSHPSLFLDQRQRRFYQRLTQAVACKGWLRFTRLDWCDRPIAFHFGFCYRGSYMWYKPSFAIDLARHSPGEALQRQLLLAAIEEKACAFDFGLGEEAFKSRFATCIRYVRTRGLYAPDALKQSGS